MKSALSHPTLPRPKLPRPKLPRPVILLTGFLGAGKTTLLNNILDHVGRENVCLLINEFGEIGVDGALLRQADDSLIEIADGCICCTVRGEVADALLQLAHYDRQYLFIETTGLADPLPLAKTLLSHRDITSQYRLSSILTVVDAERGELTLSQQQEAQKQVVLADNIFISKSELVEDGAMLERLQNRLSDFNPHARFFTGDNKNALYDALFDETDAASLVSTENLIKEDKHEDHHAHHHEEGHHGHHHHNFKTVTLNHDQPLDREQFALFLDLITSAYGDRVLRMKGYVHLSQPDEMALLQLVANRYELTPASATNDNTGENSGETKLVTIMQNMNSDLIEKLFAGFAGKTAIDTPDQDALSNNPLSIAGDWKL